MKKHLIPDVVLESVKQEYLVVEVKKEMMRISSRRSLDQTKFLVIPAAMAYGSAHALLINVFEGVVMTCSKTEDPPSLTFKQTRHMLTREDLTQDLTLLLKHLCSIVSNVE
ncbi:hypothetical protein KP79_PYT22645 [Mizuhopecten yessoensis]|uniref:Uncharacterized protein n=1 Tax=Mizuhopecten yessoensis TaxID=6573 RepID=A0A210PMX5_MIZYE|nr:hypothetical protein KP79_PYT22645 [Mizuhopecten yessoensis]